MLRYINNTIEKFVKIKTRVQKNVRVCIWVFVTYFYLYTSSGNYKTKGEMEMSKVLEEENVKTTAIQDERELLDQLLKPEVQKSLTTLVELLPQLTELVTVLAKSTETVKSLVNDERMREDTIEVVNDFVNPVKKSVRKVAANVIEAKDRAEESQEVIGIFGLLKMMKDPQVQKLFRFLNAYLQVSAENDKK